MYADDIVLLFKTVKCLQTLLCRLEGFCNKLNFKVNLDKTKIIISKKAGRVLKGYNFIGGNNFLKDVNEYKYLGKHFRSSGAFTQGLSLFAIRYLRPSSVL